jgi:serine/threonine protein kinase
VSASPVRVLGRYALYGEIAAGGMATVHFGRLLGQVGFSRTVAIKRLHPQFAKDPEFVSMFLDEARIAARVRHPNVVATIDVVATEGELFLVMDYVQGESLARLVRLSRQLKERIPPRIVVAVISGLLHGLHAAHEAKNERGENLSLVHRDVSPQNVLVGVDGITRVLDFGVAKAAGRLQTTREGHLKGKIAYMAPEQLRGVASRQSDIYAAGIVLWEAITGEKLFAGVDELETLGRVMTPKVDPASSKVPGLAPAFDVVLAKALAFAPVDRYETAREMAIALEHCDVVASSSEVSEWVERLAKSTLSARAEVLGGIESSSPDMVIDSQRLAKALEEVGVESTHTPAIAPPSVPSEVGIAEVDAPRSRETVPRSRAWPYAVTIVALFLVGFIVWRVTGEATSPVSAASAASAPAPSPPPSATATATAEPSAAPEAAPPAESASASAAPPVATHATPRPQPHVATPPPKPKHNDCDPPFTIDANGRKHYKADCL